LVLASNASVTNNTGKYPLIPPAQILKDNFYSITKAGVSRDLAVDLLSFAIMPPSPQPRLPESIPKFNGKWAGPPAESVIDSPTAGRQASLQGERELTPQQILQITNVC
jgi:hypothetical protein